MGLRGNGEEVRCQSQSTEETRKESAGWKGGQRSVLKWTGDTDTVKKVGRVELRNVSDVGLKGPTSSERLAVFVLFTWLRALIKFSN